MDVIYERPFSVAPSGGAGTVPRMSDSAKVIIEVQAGLLPGEADPKFSRRWAVTSAEWEDAQRRDAETLQQAQESGEPAEAMEMYLLLASRAAVADEYARALRDPSRINWVRTEWIWM